MVRMTAVVFLFAASALGAQSAPATVPDGSRLALGQYCYTITAMKDGAAKPIGVTFQSISRQQS